MAYPAMPTQVTCPACQTGFVVEISSIIDVGENPEQKEKFLRGEVNYAECPSCGAGGSLSTPLVYHDPAKELLVVYVPQELSLPADQQEKLVGGLVNAVMNNVPAEKRKGYFLRPQTALTMGSLYDTILEADGISKEVLQAQRERLRLIEEMLGAQEADDESLEKLVEDSRDRFDYEFFLVLSDLIDGHASRNDDEGVQRLESLRSFLLERVNIAAPKAAGPDASYDEIIDVLQEAGEGESFRRAIALNRSRLDYGLFQALTSRIDAARAGGDTELAQSLEDLRKQVLDEIDAQNEALREAEDRANLLIMTLSESDDLTAAVSENMDDIDDVVIALLLRYQQAAESQGNEKRAAKMKAILEAIMSAYEEQLPPDVRLISRVARAEYPDGTDAVLNAHRGLLNNAFLKTFDSHIEQLDQERDKETIDHLKQVRGQIVAKITIQRA